jgi:hypothetical protein
VIKYEAKIRWRESNLRFSHYGLIENSNVPINSTIVSDVKYYAVGDTFTFRTAMKYATERG